LHQRHLAVELWPVTREKKILIDDLTGGSLRYSSQKRRYAKTYLQNTSRLQNTINLLYLTVGDLDIARKGR
jgi:hypothetical protein